MTTPQKYLDQGVQSVVAANGLPALAAAIVHHGGAQKVWSAKGVRRLGASGPANQIQASDRFPLGSVSKPFTGLLMGRLAKAGIMSWTTKLVDVFPEIADPSCRARYAIRSDYLNVTVEQIMSHQSGFCDQFRATNPRSDPPDWPEFWFWNEPNPGPLGTEWLNKPGLMWRRFLYAIMSMQLPPMFPPGQGLGYGGAPTICAAVAERAGSGMTFEELYDQQVFQPAGMTQSSWKRHSTTPSPPDGPYEHELDGTPYDAPALVQSDFAAHAAVGAVNCSARDLTLMIEQNLPATPGTSARIFTDAELAHAQEVIGGTLQNGVTRCGWGYTELPKQLWHTGSNGRHNAAIRIYPELGYGVAASTTINKDTAIGAMLDYLETMQKNWKNLFA
jgi:CubicO group peptidase (beta-lactamase class C family)